MTLHSNQSINIILLIVLFLFSSNIIADDKAVIVTDGEFSSTMDVAKDFTDAIPTIIESVINDSVFSSTIKNLYYGFGLIFIILAASEYALSGGMSLQKAIISMTVFGFIMSSYLWLPDFLLGSLSFARGIGNTVQNAVLGSSNPNYPVEFMFNVTGKFDIDFDWSFFFNPMTRLNYLIEVIILALVSILMILLAAVSVIGSLIQSYVFVPIAIAGFIALPFGLIPMFGFILDGWLRLFFTIVFFGIFLRILIALAVFALSLMFNVHDISDFEGRIFSFTTDDVSRLLGAASIALLALWSVLNAFTFASAIVSGQSRGMFGGSGAVQQLNNHLNDMKKG